VFRSDGIEVVRTPFRAPQANGVAERFVRTVRSECLDWLLILNQQHLERTLAAFVDHYNRGRPHTSLGPGIPDAPDLAPTPSGHRIRAGHCVVATPILRGLHHDYRLESRAA
jgi:transposase InsO family protein